MADEEVPQQFTPAAIRVVQYAKEEARRLRRRIVGTEHVLLGLVREQGVAARILDGLGVNYRRVQDETIRQSPAEQPKGSSRNWSEEARGILEWALVEARELNPKLGRPNLVESEHVLLGLTRLPGSAAEGVLRALGVTFEQVRREVMAHVGLTATTAFLTPTPDGLSDLLDTNTRFGYDPVTGGTTTPEAVKAAGVKWGVVAAYIYSLNAVIFDAVAGNQETWELGQKDEFFRPVAVLSPFSLDPASTPAAVKARGFAFARLFPERHGYALEGFAARDLLTACGEADLPVMVSVQGTSPVQVARGAAELRGTLLLTGVGYHSLGEVLSLAGHVPNLYLDVGGVATPDGIALLAEAFGAERLVFGSNYPSLQVGCGAMLLRESGLSKEARELIGRGNAQRVLEVRG